MSTGVTLALGAAALAIGLLAFYLRRHRPQPCPASASFLLENPWVNGVAGAGLLLDRAGVEVGMRVLDVGCGPGRITVPAAERVGPGGEVVAVDMQQEMLEKLRARVVESGLENVRMVHGIAGDAGIERDHFDRALLVTVLGEIRDKAAALAEIFAALKPGGVLSITELLPDPDYQPRGKVQKMAEAAGFRLCDSFGTVFSFTLNFVRPGRG